MSHFVQPPKPPESDNVPPAIEGTIIGEMVSQMQTMANTTMLGLGVVGAFCKHAVIEMNNPEPGNIDDDQSEWTLTFTLKDGYQKTISAVNPAILMYEAGETIVMMYHQRGLCNDRNCPIQNGERTPA